jgi:hypothetical protein
MIDLNPKHGQRRQKRKKVFVIEPKLKYCLSPLNDLPPQTDEST